MNSNELNERILDACLDPACFQILYAYIKLGGWNEDNEVYLSRTHYQKWGIKKRTLSEHRKHLIEAGWLVPTGNKSEAGFNKFIVAVPPVQNLHDPHAESARPPSNICTTPAQDLPTEVIKSNEVSNELSNEENDKKNEDDKEDQDDPATLIGSTELEALPPISFKERGGASAVARWKERQGIKTVQTEGPEWAKPDWKPAPVAVLEKPTCPNGGKCGGGN